MNFKKEKDLVKKAAEEILQKQGKEYGKWKKEILDKKKLEVMSDNDKAWTEQTVNEASIQLILENFQSNKVTTNGSNNQY